MKQLLLSGAYGDILPQIFAQTFDLFFAGNNAQDMPFDISTLADGPNNEFYVDCWENVLEHFRFYGYDGQPYRLLDEVHLFAIPTLL